MDNFGQMVKNRRKQRGMSTRELSSQIQMSSAYVSQLERGLVKRPSYEVAKRIADVLDIKESILEYFGFTFETLERRTTEEALNEIEHRREMEVSYRDNLTEQLKRMDLENLEIIAFVIDQQMEIAAALYTIHRAGSRHTLTTINEFVDFLYRKVTS